MSSSLNTAVSGLKAFSEALSIISNNIANSSTTSYKSSSVSFVDLLNQSIAASASSTTGSGVSVSNVSTDWTQGSTNSTETETNMYINGNGFFLVKNEVGNGEVYYTRNGEFDFDDNNILTNSLGYTVQGYAIDQTTGNLSSLGDISISYASTAPVATTTIGTNISLDSSYTSGQSWSTTMTTYDSLGDKIPITLTFTKSATANEWTWSAAINSSYGTLGGTSSGTLDFSSGGTLSTTGTDPAFSLTLTNGATTPQTITWDLYDTSGATNGSIVQYNDDCILNNSSQNGAASVALTDITIGTDGVIAGSYSDGTTRDLYQIALANFSNYSGLDDVGNSMYQASSQSGVAVIGVAGTGQFGTIKSNTLEGSNVDLSTQLANLITAQRSYEACARVFTSADEVMQTTVNMK